LQKKQTKFGKDIPLNEDLSAAYMKRSPTFTNNQIARKEQKRIDNIIRLYGRNQPNDADRNLMNWNWNAKSRPKQEVKDPRIYGRYLKFLDNKD